jgi:hypothetical protein
MIIHNKDIDSSGLPPEGIHLLQIVKAETQFSRSKGEEMLVLNAETVAGKDKLKIYLMLEGRGTFAIPLFCDACQLLRPRGPNASFDLSPKVVKGRYFYGEIVHRTTTDGNVRAQIARYLTFEGALEAIEFTSQDASQLPKIEQEPLELPVVVVQPPAKSNPAPSALLKEPQANGGSNASTTVRIVKAAHQCSASVEGEPSTIPF